MNFNFTLLLVMAHIFNYINCFLENEHTAARADELVLWSYIRKTGLIILIAGITFLVLHIYLLT